ncbi:MAG: flagellar protein [bacterium]|nr:flagellar protein [bacterium]
MNIRNCKMCGRIFNYVSGPAVCPSCKDSLEVKFQEVKDYIREHKGVGINEVAEACDVEAAQIRQWLREDRLEVTEDSALYLSCESCGAPIRSGRFCEKCKNNMAKNLNSAISAGKPAPKPERPKEEGGAKMRFLQ